MCLLVLIFLHKNECFVPQTSIFGPIFFSYIDIANANSILKFHIYADDTSILYRNSDPNTIVNKVNQKITKITKQFESNKLNLNIKNMLLRPSIPVKK